MQLSVISVGDADVCPSGQHGESAVVEPGRTSDAASEMALLKTEVRLIAEEYLMYSTIPLLADRVAAMVEDVTELILRQRALR